LLNTQKTHNLSAMKPPINIIAEKTIKCEACSLSQICIPNGLTDSEIEELETSIDKSIKVKKKALVFRSNEKANGIYAVKSGAVKTSIANKDGLEQVVEFHLPGDLLGFDAFDTGEHKCNATALEDTLLCRISLEEFDGLCDRLSGVRKVMFHQVGKEITHNQNLLLSLGQQQTDERFAVFLLKVAAHYQSRGFSSKEFTLPMPRQDLSNYLGMAVETLSRIITRMSESGILETNRRMITIKDLAKLEKIAHVTCSTDHLS